MPRKHAFLLVACCALLQACTNIGPATVKRDRFDYNTAISDSWKEQTLLNIVKLRYADMPVFVEVASVVSGYQLEGSVNLGGTVSSSDAAQRDFLNFGTTGKYIDRPTVTYQPITGSHFNKSFMTPIPPRAILFLLQSGWLAELVYPLTVDSVNGLRSQFAAGAMKRAGSSDYYRMVELLTELQRSGAVGMQIKKKGEEDTTVLFFHGENLEPPLKDSLAQLRALLGLDPGAAEYTVVYGRVAQNSAELAITTFSMLQILIKLATMVEVPEEDVASGATVPSTAAGFRQPVRIRQGESLPDSVFVSTRYRDRWFWIDDGDFDSKRAFTFLMVLFSLTETGGREGLPLVTIPTG
ncbi:MAG: hypothetical protein ACU85V_00375 [Gammaproteobacteria bacterium]